MINITPADIKRFLADEDDQPVVMLNLLRFKTDGGRQRYLDYLALAGPIVTRHGAEIIFAGDGAAVLCAEPGQSWDAVALARYPNRSTFVNMIADPDLCLCRSGPDVGTGRGGAAADKIATPRRIQKGFMESCMVVAFTNAQSCKGKDIEMSFPHLGCFIVEASAYSRSSMRIGKCRTRLPVAL